MHVRRTTRPDGDRDPILPLRNYPGVKGREDRYIDAYFGTEYSERPWPEGPMEVITRTYQAVFTGIGSGHTKKTVQTLMKDDPELLNFALGALFRYDPL